jgi:multiple sugar transport system ATP-binding protein
LAHVELRGVAKRYPGGIEAVRPLDLTVEDGTLFVIVGPSGSGKSTLLRLIAGLEPLTAGTVWIDGRRVDALAPRDRDVAMVFQTPVVYPFLSVFENLAFGLRARGTPRLEVERAVAEAAGVLGLEGLLTRRPGTLSGGERQRVALGRALVRRPRVFLLDEPFSSLDVPLRAALRADLIELHRSLGTTMIHVTHDQAEAMALGCRIAVLKDGRIVQTGAPLDVYGHPACRFVGEFIGSPPMSILPCLVENTGPATRIRVVGAPDETAWSLGEEQPWPSLFVQRDVGRIDLGIRAEQIHVIDPSAAAESALVVQTVVRRLESRGADTVATLAVGPHALSARLAAHPRIKVGDSLAVVLDPSGIVWFDPASGLAVC